MFKGIKALRNEVKILREKGIVLQEIKASCMKAYRASPLMGSTKQTSKKLLHCF